MLNNVVMCIYRTVRPVAFQDVDAAHIVYFAKFLEYCHDAYFAYLDSAGLSLADVIASGEYILPLVHTEADFAKPLRFGDAFEVIVQKAIPHKSSYTVEYQICAPGDENTIFCTAKTTHAIVNRKTFKAIKHIPEELKTILKM